MQFDKTTESPRISSKKLIRIMCMIKSQRRQSNTDFFEFYVSILNQMLADPNQSWVIKEACLYAFGSIHEAALQTTDYI